MWPFQGGGDWRSLQFQLVLFWVRNKTKKLSSRKFFIKLRQLSRNLLESWEGDSCSSSNQSPESLRFVFIIKSKSGETIKFWKKKNQRNKPLIKRGWRWDKKLGRQWLPFHTKEAFKGETQEKPKRTRIASSWQTDRHTDRQMGDFVPRFKASTRQH